MSTNEYIHCTNVICICGKSAVHAAKVLAHPAFLRHRLAKRTYAGGISEINGDKTNTVLLRQHLDPCNDLPVCPRGDCLAEILASAGLPDPESLSDLGQFYPALHSTHSTQDEMKVKD
jgi:hypothetical protein